MRRALRFTGNIVTVLSLLLCVATMDLWLQSYRVRDIVTFSSGDGNSHVLQSILGRLHLLSQLDYKSNSEATHRAVRLSPQDTWNGGTRGYPPDDDVQWRLGFVCQTYEFTFLTVGHGDLKQFNRLIIVPYWFPAGVFALAPLAWMAGRIRKYCGFRSRWLRRAV
jgi:hypothetical protein